MDYGWLPQIDTSALFKMGQGIANRRQNNRMGEALSGLGQGASLEQMATALQDINPELSVKLMTAAREADALAGYREESLKPPIVREYESIYGGGQASGGQPSVPVASGPNPATSGGVPTLADYAQGKKGGSIAEQSVDREFGKDYVDWKAKGGYSYTKRQLNQLDSAARDTEAAIADPAEGYEGITGPWTKLIPDFAEGFLNPKGRVVRQKVEEAIQSSLRAVLGAQYTQVEGENLLRRTWDPALDEAENVKRVRSVMKQLDDMAKAKESAAQYYEQNGTLRGWNGPSLSIDSIDPAAPTGQEIAVSVPGKNTDRYTNAPTAAEAGAVPGDTVLDNGAVIEGTTPDPAGSYFRAPTASGSAAIQNIKRLVAEGKMTVKQAIAIINANKHKWGVEVDESR